jgi:hypothetical protein
MLKEKFRKMILNLIFFWTWMLLMVKI